MVLVGRCDRSDATKRFANERLGSPVQLAPQDVSPPGRRQSCDVLHCIPSSRESYDAQRVIKIESPFRAKFNRYAINYAIRERPSLGLW